MLAYLFWHRPREGVPAGDYERALETFHRSLARRPPAGMTALASYRLAELPWQARDTPAGPPDAIAQDPPEGLLLAPAYEDWYLVDDYGSLGVLNEAAAGRGHRSRHDDVAALTGPGAGRRVRAARGRAGRGGAGRGRRGGVGRHAPAGVQRPARPRTASGRRSCWATAWTAPPPASGAASSCSVRPPSSAWWRPSRRRARARAACLGDGALACSRASRCGASEGKRVPLDSAPSSQLAFGWSSPPGSGERAADAARLGTLNSDDHPSAEGNEEPR